MRTIDISLGILWTILIIGFLYVSIGSLSFHDEHETVEYDYPPPRFDCRGFENDVREAFKKCKKEMPESPDAWCVEQSKIEWCNTHT